MAVAMAGVIALLSVVVVATASLGVCYSARGQAGGVAGERLEGVGEPRLGGIGQVLAQQLEELTGYETRVTVLGHLQRGGSPSAFDRVLATRLGVGAVGLVKEGVYGVMVAMKGNRIVHVPLEEALANRPVEPELYRMAQIFT